MNEALGNLWRAAQFQPGVRRTERRVAGEGQLAAWGEYPHPVVPRTSGRRQDERRLGQIRPPSNALHVRVFEILGVEDHGHRVAKIRGGGEDVDLGELALASHTGGPSVSRSRWP